MIKRLFLYFILLIFSFSLLYSGNNPGFFVVNVKGKITKKSGNSKWISVKNNDVLQFDDKIFIPEKSFINLYDKNKGRYFVIHGIRNFAIKDLLENKVNNSEQPVTAIFVKAFENLANAFSGITENRELKQFFRSAQSENGLIPVMPKNTKVFGDTIHFEWIISKPSSEVKLSLCDENFNLLFDTLISGINYCNVVIPLNRGQEYIWQVTDVKTKKNFINYFSSANENDMFLLNNQIDTLVKLHGSNKTSNFHVLKGLICEENGFKQLAYSELKEAYLLSKKNEKYAKLIEEFFSRSKVSLKFTDIKFYK